MFSELGQQLTILINQKLKIEKKLDSFSYADKYASILINMFTTLETDTNPFYNSPFWEFNFVESILLLNGCGAVWYDDIDKKYVFSACTRTGNIDSEGHGRDLFCCTMNGHSKTFLDYENDDNVVVIWNNLSHSCDINVGRFSKNATETWTSIKACLVGTRYNNIVSCSSEIEKKALDTAIENVEVGKPITITSDNILGLSEDGIKRISLTDVKDSDKIQYLDNHLTWLDRTFLNNYGLTTQGSDKIAQQTKDEINNGTLASWVEPISRLNERKRGFALVKEKFGLDIPYKFSELWSNEYKKVINTLGIEDINNIEEGVTGVDNNVRDNTELN